MSQIQNTEFFRVFRVPFDYPVHSLRETVLPKPVVPMERQDSEGVSFADLESLWPGIWQIQAPEGCPKVVTWPSRKLKMCIQAHLEKFADSTNAVLFDLWRKITKLSRKKTSSVSRRLWTLKPSWTDARRQYILLIFLFIFFVFLVLTVFFCSFAVLR